MESKTFFCCGSVEVGSLFPIIYDGFLKPSQVVIAGFLKPSTVSMIYN